MRPEVISFVELGRLPIEDSATVELVREVERRYQSIKRPVSDDEARALVQMFNSDGCFGIASSLMHLVETAPGRPILDCLENSENEWVAELRHRAIRSGHVL